MSNLQLLLNGDYMEYVPAKRIVTKNKKPAMWFGCDYNMNIYRGCSHGCIYCDSRSSCYGDSTFDRVKIKENALLTIRDELRRKVKKGVIATGAMSDPYNPLEKKEELTRKALQLISAFGFGAALDTKSSLVTRDIDILEEIKENNPVIVKLTITTADKELCKIIEPNVSDSEERFNALARLSDKGIYSGVLLTPVLPFINDNEENILHIIKNAYNAGAKFIYPGFGVTLRDNQREYFYGKLDSQFPGIKEQYIKKYRNNYMCTSPKSKALWQLFIKECEAKGLLYKMQDIIRHYRLGYEDVQLKFF